MPKGIYNRKTKSVSKRKKKQSNSPEEIELDKYRMNKKIILQLLSTIIELLP